MRRKREERRAAEPRMLARRMVVRLREPKEGVFVE